MDRVKGPGTRFDLSGLPMHTGRALLARLGRLEPEVVSRPRWAGYGDREVWNTTRGTAHPPPKGPGRSTSTSSGRGSGRRSTAFNGLSRDRDGDERRGTGRPISPSDGIFVEEVLSRGGPTQAAGLGGSRRGDVKRNIRYGPDGDDGALIRPGRRIAQIRKRAGPGPRDGNWDTARANMAMALFEGAGGGRGAGRRRYHHP